MAAAWEHYEGHIARCRANKALIERHNLTHGCALALHVKMLYLPRFRTDRELDLTPPTGHFSHSPASGCALQSTDGASLGDGQRPASQVLGAMEKSTRGQ